MLEKQRDLCWLQAPLGCQAWLSAQPSPPPEAARKVGSLGRAKSSGQTEAQCRLAIVCSSYNCHAVACSHTVGRNTLQQHLQERGSQLWFQLAQPCSGEGGGATRGTASPLPPLHLFHFHPPTT